MRRAALVVAAALMSSTAAAAPPEPSGAHPRMLLDDEVRTAWQAEAKAGRGPVKGAIALCSDAQGSSRYDRGLYQGSEWAKVLQACLVAWAATEKAEHAKTAIRFFNAMLDDKDRIGDGLGGDTAAQQDSGYVIRNIGPYTALAYDWLHAQLTPEQRAKARKRWAAWLAWYREHGYRARSPGNNYHAGYLVAVTLISVAQGGEAGEEGAELWKFVADELWAKDMAKALAPGGILDGGDWPEGWQYGPLAVSNYALAARVARRAGIEIDGVDRWLASVLRRHVHGLSPGDKVYAAADTQFTTPNLDVHVLTLNAIALGDAPADAKKWAKGELARLRLVDKDYLLHSALATIGDRPALVPRTTWPTWYMTNATGTLFARTRWDDRAVWFVAECAKTLDADHRHPKTGNFVLSRGGDDVIVDPSPYGSQSTLTSNAPTVASAQFPDHYQPSQGSWGESSGWELATQTASGIVIGRCDYADQYRFQHTASDVPEALRDFVLLPSRDGTDAALVVVDRATTGDERRGLHLRFRVPTGIELEGDVGRSRIGRTQLVIHGIARNGGSPEIGLPNGKDCYAKGTVKGQCNAARFPVSDYRVVVPGPEPRAVHVIGATGGAAVTTRKLRDKDWSGVHVSGLREAIVVWPHRPRAAFSYRAPRGAAVSHVILDAPEADGKLAVTARRDGDACSVRVEPGGDHAARPAVLTLDASCAVLADATAATVSSARGTKPARPRAPGTTRRSGCCGAQATPSASGAIASAVLALLVRRRRRTA